MTSIYHRRFYPDDVDATVAYVAPISFGHADPRYIPFLDAIGTDECREAMRSIQRLALERFDELQPLAADAALRFGMTFEQAGGHAAAFESAIRAMEWGYWQYLGADGCATIPARDELTDVDDLFAYVTGWVGYGASDDSRRDSGLAAYNYQAARELGYPAYSTTHIADVLRYDPVPWWVPEGTDPELDPSAMRDVQRWVVTEGSEIVFVYGEYDPWTGGAFEIPIAPGVVHVTAPEANHGATIRTLTETDRAGVLNHLEEWLGARPAIDGAFDPARADLPPRLLTEHLPI